MSLNSSSWDFSNYEETSRADRQSREPGKCALLRDRATLCGLTAQSNEAARRQTEIFFSLLDGLVLGGDFKGQVDRVVGNCVSVGVQDALLELGRKASAEAGRGVMIGQQMDERRQSVGTASSVSSVGSSPPSWSLGSSPCLSEHHRPASYNGQSSVPLPSGRRASLGVEAGLSASPADRSNI